MKHSQGHMIYYLAQCQWTTDAKGTEDARICRGVLWKWLVQTNGLITLCKKLWICYQNIALAQRGVMFNKSSRAT